MDDVLQFLQHRNSSPRLCEPAPGLVEVCEMIRAALRVPDHAWLRPWRFLLVAGDRREALGQLFENCLLQRDPGADSTARAKAAAAPLRAPLIIVVVARPQEHPKVPRQEQLLSAGCAAYAILLAAEAQGYAGVWRTGDAAFDRALMSALGLTETEEITGFIYLGSRDGSPKSLPDLNPDEFLSCW